MKKKQLEERVVTLEHLTHAQHKDIINLKLELKALIGKSPNDIWENIKNVGDYIKAKIKIDIKDAIKGDYENDIDIDLFAMDECFFNRPSNRIILNPSHLKAIYKAGQNNPINKGIKEPELNSGGCVIDWKDKEVNQSLGYKPNYSLNEHFNKKPTTIVAKEDLEAFANLIHDRAQPEKITDFSSLKNGFYSGVRKEEFFLVKFWNGEFEYCYIDTKIGELKRVDGIVLNIFHFDFLTPIDIIEN